MRDVLAPDANVRHRPLLMKEIEKYVTVHTGCKGLEVTKEGILCEDKEGKQRMLRSLMNIRMPGKLSEEVLAIQDEYLAERAKEKGVVQLSDIPVIRDSLSIWQGDITRLAVDAIVNAANSQMLGCFVPMHTCIDKATHIRITHLSNYIMASC